MREKTLFLALCLAFMLASCIGGLQLREGPGSGSGVLGVGLVMPSQIGSCQAVPIAGSCSPDGVDNVTISSLDFTEVTDFECDCASGAIGNCVDGAVPPAPVTSMEFCGTGPNGPNPQVVATIEDEDGNTSSDTPPTEIVTSSDLVTIKTVNESFGMADCAMSADPCIINPGADFIGFDITVTNNGLDDNTGVSLEDLCPANSSYSTTSQVVLADGTIVIDPTTLGVGVDGYYDATAGEWNIGALANGQTTTLTLVCSIDDLDILVFENVATAAAGDILDPDLTTDDLEAAVSKPYADLQTVKSIDGSSMCQTGMPCANSQEVVYNLTVTNNGIVDSDAALILNDLCPGGTSYVSDDGGGAYDSITGDWSITGPLSVAASVTLLLTCKVEASVGAEIINDLAAGAACDPDLTSCEVPDPQDADDVLASPPIVITDCTSVSGLTNSIVRYYVTSITKVSTGLVEMTMDDGSLISVEATNGVVNYPINSIQNASTNVTQTGNNTPLVQSSSTDDLGYCFLVSNWPPGPSRCQELEFSSSLGNVAGFGLDITDMDGTPSRREYVQNLSPIPLQVTSFTGVLANGPEFMYAANDSGQVADLDGMSGFLGMDFPPPSTGSSSDGAELSVRNLDINTFKYESCGERFSSSNGLRMCATRFYRTVCSQL